MPEAEQLYQQQLAQDQALQARLKAEDRARQEAAGSLPKKNDISTVEFALIGLVAGLKDAVSAIATLTIIGIIVAIFVNIPCSLILWLWCAIRLHKLPFKRLLSSTLAGFTPIIGALPFWTGFVVSVFLEQKGYIPKFLQKKLVSPAST